LALTKVTSGIIEDGTIVNADLSSSIAVTGGQLADDAVTTAKILDNNVTIGKISGSAAASAGTYLKQDGTWAAVASGPTNDVFWENAQTVSSDYTITASKNALTAGDITVNSGITVTVPVGASWVIV